MNARFEAICQLGGALLTAAAGIFHLIDETTMVVLVVVLTSMSGGCDCIRPRKA